jgi:MSHA biogenesis protein MshM
MSTLYLAHFGLAEAPFAITPNPQFFYAGASRGELLRALRCAVASEEGIIVVTGEVGSGKTMLCRMLLAELPAGIDAVYLANPAFARDEIVGAIARDLGLDAAAAPGAPTALERLQGALIERHEAGRRVVLFIDEAHAMSAEALEEVRRLSNLETSRHKLLNIVLFGQPELDELLAQPRLRQLRERVVQRLQLPPLPAGQVADYVECRLRAAGYRGAALFAPPALRRLRRRSQGLTRRINLLADKALLACYARGGCRVERADVRRAELDLAFARPRLPRLLAAAALALAPAVLAGAWLLARPLLSSAATAPLAASAQPDSASAREEDALAEALRAAQRWPRTPGTYAVRLMTLREPDAARLAGRLADLRATLAGDAAQLGAVTDAERPDRTIVYLGPFADAAAAERARQALPEELQSHRPHVARWPDATGRTHR